MNYYTHVESTRFKVKDPKKFREDFKRRVSEEDGELHVFEDGFQIWSTNPVIEYESEDEVYDEPEMDIPDVIQPHLRDGEIVRLVYLNESAKNSDLGASMCVVTPLAIAWKSSAEVLDEMVKNIYPRKVKCVMSCKNHETNMWIEEGKEYVALESHKNRNRKYYVIEQNGHEITWGKEYFDGGAEG